MAENESGGKEMTFWEHLDELRKVFFKSAIAIVLLMIIIFCSKDFIFDKIVFAAIDSNFVLYRFFDKALLLLGLPQLEPFSIELINIDLSAQFFIHISTTNSARTRASSSLARGGGSVSGPLI